MAKKGENKVVSEYRPCTEYAQRELPRLTKVFASFLEKHDPSYKEKIDFIVTCKDKNDSFKIRVLPMNDYDSRQYFKDTFGETSGNARLEEFMSSNNVREIVHGFKK